VFVCLLVAGCAATDRGAAAAIPAAADDDNDDNDDNDDDSSPYSPCESTATAVYSLDAGAVDIPYPNNFFAVADPSTPTGLHLRLVGETTRMLDYFLPVKAVQCLRWGLNTLNGFGTMPTGWFTLSDPPNLDTFSLHEKPTFDDGALLIRLGDVAADDAPVAIVPSWTPGDKLLELAPHTPLDQTTRYAFVLTDRTRTADGRCYAASATFDRIRRGQPATDAEAHAAEALGDLFDRLAAHGIDRLAVSAATVFTTQDLRTDMEDIRTYLDTHDAPALEIDEVQPPPADWQGVSELLVATLHAQSWRNADGALQRDASGALMTFGDEKLATWIAMPLPENAQEPMPVVVFQHGFQADKSEMSGVVPWLCTAGYAVVGIDLPAHGSRNPLPAFLNGWGYMNFFNPLAWRDNSRQAAADQMALVRGLANLAKMDVWPPGGDGKPDLDVGNVLFLGHSLGAMTGGITTALDPTFQVSALHAPFADFHSLILNSPFGEIALFILKEIQDHAGLPADDRTLEFMDVYFPILESGVMLGYAPLYGQSLPGGSGPPEALIEINAFDWAVPPPSTYLLLGSAGIPLMEPLVYSVTGLQTIAAPHAGTTAFQYPTAVHGSLLGDPSNPVFAAVQRQVVTYFNSKLATGVAEAINPWE
jgi:hypothetical protein